MREKVGLRQRIHNRIYGDLIGRWRDGMLDDRAFERAYRLRAQLIIQPVFLLSMVLPATMDWMARDISFGEHLNRLPIWVVLYATIALVIGLRMDRLMRYGARDLFLRRGRADAERKAQVAQATGRPLGNDSLTYGRFARSPQYGNWVLHRTVGGTAILTLMAATFVPRAGILLFVLVPLTLWSIIARFDRRPTLDISPAGVWCRRWGRARIPYTDFKAVYPRQAASGQQGIVLVPHSVARLKPKLSWAGRYALRSGENVPAHAGTLTIWTSRVGLPRDALLRGLQAEISKVERSPLS